MANDHGIAVIEAVEESERAAPAAKKQPAKRFVGKRAATEKAQQQPHGSIEDNGAIQGSLH